MILLFIYFRYRRNLLTFSEVILLLFISLFYFLLESALILVMYQAQDNIGPTAVFYTMRALYAVFHCFILVSLFSFIRGESLSLVHPC